MNNINGLQEPWILRQIAGKAILDDEEEGCERCHEFFLSAHLNHTGEDSLICDRCLQEMKEMSTT